MTRLLAIDPGKATGWSLWEYTDRTLPKRLGYGVIHEGYSGFLHWWETSRPIPVSLVVCEKFHLDLRAQKPDLTPVYIEGALPVLTAVPIVWHQTSKKAGVKDQLLKDHGWWVTGKMVDHTDGRDTNDSQIHALVYLKEHHSMTQQWLWTNPDAVTGHP